jgi:RNA polymerase sporulation-specific sigma factor
MVRRIAGSLYLPGGEREDLAQEARVGILGRDPRVGPRPVRALSLLRLVVRHARGHHGGQRRARRQASPLNHAHWLHRALGEEGAPLEETLIATGRPDDDPVAKTLGRERLRGMLDATRTLSALERGALALSANDRTHREGARELGVGERAVNNALQRARRKLV